MGTAGASLTLAINLGSEVLAEAGQLGEGLGAARAFELQLDGGWGARRRGGRGRCTPYTPYSYEYEYFMKEEGGTVQYRGAGGGGVTAAAVSYCTVLYGTVATVERCPSRDYYRPTVE